jgi:hypothetical protein
VYRLPMNWLYEPGARYLTGHDVFISYAHADSSTYASHLGIELGKARLRCYLDQYSGRADSKIPPAVMIELRRASMLVLIASEVSLESPAVREEIDLFVKTGRPICPIAPPDDATRAALKKLLPGLAPATETTEALRVGVPSAWVLNRIDAMATFRRLAQRQRRANRAALGLLAALALTLVGVGTLLSSASAQLRNTEALVQNATLVADAQADPDPLRRAQILSRLDPTHEPRGALDFVIDMAHSRIPRELPLPKGVRAHVSFDPSGRYFTDGCCTLWDAKRVTLLKKLDASRAIFLEDGRGSPCFETRRSKCSIWPAGSRSRKCQ